MAARKPRTTRPRRSRKAAPGDDLAAYYASIKEAPFQQHIITVCKQLGYLVFHDPDARRCPHCGQMFFDRRIRGFPDLVILRWPRLGDRGPWVLFVELKTETGRLREEQKAWSSCLKAISKVVPGLYYGVWRPSQWPAIERLLLPADARADTQAAS